LDGNSTGIVNTVDAPNTKRALEDFAERVAVVRSLSPSDALGSRGPTLHAKQVWEGVVTKLTSTDFSAIVRDRTNPLNPEESVVIERDELSPADADLVVEGAAFYWVVGAERTPAGQQKNVSVIQFKRLPRWTDRRIAQAKARVQQLQELFSDES
jgi:hypothetical protein